MPIWDVQELRTESDVEQKFLLPFLTHPSFVGLPIGWIRTKEYMTPTEIDKAAGKRHGYIPDYSIWINGIPVGIVEAKAPDITVELGLREARLYAAEINKRYPPNVNPIAFVLSSNGEQIGISQWDSETEALIAASSDAGPGTAVLDAIRNAFGPRALEAHAVALSGHFQGRPFHRVAAFMGGQARITELLGVNEFARSLFPILTKYFASTEEEAPDEVVDRAYVSSNEIGTYQSVLETYLKDRVRSTSGNQIQEIQTTRSSASGISTEISKYSQTPKFYSRVQLIIGSVGAGKSTFIRRYYRRIMAKEVAKNTKWAFLDFNNFVPGSDLQKWIGEKFLESFSTENNVDIYDLNEVEKLFSVELNRFNRGPAKLLKSDVAEYNRQKVALLTKLMDDSVAFTQAVTRHYAGEKGIGIVIVFDNVDKRSRDEQLRIFESAQWFKDVSKALVIVNLRDSTFEAHKDEKPLDAFINAINFYIAPPRFAQVIRKRLEIVLEQIEGEVSKRQTYKLESGASVSYPPSKLGEFLLSIYLSLFDRSSQIASALEALVAKDVRRALGLFSDIIVSPHILPSQITRNFLTSGERRIQESRLIRALMLGRYKYFNGQSVYVRDVICPLEGAARPSNFILCDALEFLIRNRKSKIDFAQEGYALAGTLVKRLSQLGYEEADAWLAIETLVRWGLIEPESLVIESVAEEDPIRAHASGFIHMRYFLQKPEYLIGITPSLGFATREAAQELGAVWSSYQNLPELPLSAKKKILTRLSGYIDFEYLRRCRRHAFYEEAGFGGRMLRSSLRAANLSLARSQAQR